MLMLVLIVKWTASCCRPIFLSLAVILRFFFFCCHVFPQQAPIHNSAPTFEEQGKSQEILVTGIKVGASQMRLPCCCVCYKRDIFTVRVVLEA